MKILKHRAPSTLNPSFVLLVAVLYIVSVACADTGSPEPTLTAPTPSPAEPVEPILQFGTGKDETSRQAYSFGTQDWLILSIRDVFSTDESIWINIIAPSGFGTNTVEFRLLKLNGETETEFASWRWSVSPDAHFLSGMPDALNPIPQGRYSLEAITVGQVMVTGVFTMLSESDDPRLR